MSAITKWFEDKTSWSGGPTVLVLVLLVELVLIGVFAFNPLISAALIIAALTIVFVMDRPLIGVGMLIAARLLSTGATVFVRIGKIGIGPFEPALILCLIALILHVALKKKQLWRTWPWQAPYLLLMGWVGLSIVWSRDMGDGLSEVLPMLLVVANALVILAFVQTWEDFRLMLWFWVGTCVLIGGLAILTDTMGISTTDVSFEAASGGGRETGLGQQPNWFAMNLMFIIHTCFGLALVEKRKIVRWTLVTCGFFIFVMMLKSGSRGGAYATLIGGVLAAMAHPLFRKWFLRFTFITIFVFTVGITFDIGDTAKALTRISSNISLHNNFRQLNWLVCMQMFIDTHGLGIGAGGYVQLLPRYNNYVAQSLYDYPHGIFWQIIAHLGIAGLVLGAWIVGSIAKMTSEVIRLSRGTEAEVFAWTMPAAMLGYGAWSFVEFTLNDKPFWEFLTLYTALYLILKRREQTGEKIAAWTRPLPQFWKRPT